MHHTIYFGPRKLIFYNGIQDALSLDLSSFEYQRPYTSENDFVWALNAVSNNNESVVLTHNNIDLLLEQLKGHLKYVEAAGGVVLGPELHVLMIYRQGKWDLPKGHLDPGEDLASCALREVAEETGVANVAISRRLQPTYHTYWRDGVHLLKASHWFLMEATACSQTSPQIDEGIEACKWVPVAELSQYLANTHPSVRDILAYAKPFLV